MSIMDNMPNVKILQPSNSKYAKDVLSGQKYANLATLSMALEVSRGFLAVTMGEYVPLNEIRDLMKRQSTANYTTM